MDSDDDIMTIKDFIESCEDGMFIDYDGFGYAISNGVVDKSKQIYPSERNKISETVTHIVWYNK